MSLLESQLDDILPSLKPSISLRLMFVFACYGVKASDGATLSGHFAGK